jgi:hypothetical protein
MDALTIPCAACGSLGDYLEIENPQERTEYDAEPGHFPPEVAELQPPSEALAQYFRFKNARLLKCFECGTFFWYREWAPGGSEDVMRTYIHESLQRLSLLEAYVELAEARYQAHRQAQEYGGSYEAEYDQLRDSVAAEMEHLRMRWQDLVLDVVDALENRHRSSEELAETLRLYSPDRDHSDTLRRQREREEEVAAYRAGVLAEYLPPGGVSSLPPDVQRRLAILAADSNEQVARNIRSALGSLEGGAG